MIDPRYTPPPWRWHRIGDSYVLWGDHGNRPVVLDVGTTGPLLQVRNELGLMVEFYPEHADMRLISAAAHLADACASVYSKLGSAEWGEPSHAEEILGELIATEWPRLLAALTSAGVVRTAAGI